MPFLEYLSKRQIKSKLEELKSFEKLSVESQREIQRNNLCELLYYCQENIPYYTRIFAEQNFQIEKVRTDIGELKKLPLLTKEIIRKESENLKAKDRGYLHVRKTGGSTGQSVFFYYDNEGLDWTAAINLFALEMAGKKAHHSDCHIGADLEFAPPPWKWRIQDYFKLMGQNRSRLLLSSFSDFHLEKAYRRLKKIKPYLLQGHPSSIYAIASYIEKKGYRLQQLCKVFEPSGEMFTPKMVEKVEKFIGCEFVNRYGNAEFGVVAHSQMGKGVDRLKVFERAFYVEDCTSDTLIITAFTNLGFPLLRYDCGDVGSVETVQSGTFIHSIQGRVHDVVNIQGDIVPTHFIMDFLDHKVRGVREFQIILRKNSTIPLLRIVSEDTQEQPRIREAIRAKWSVGIDIEFVEFGNLRTVGWRKKFRHLIDERGDG